MGVGYSIMGDQSLSFVALASVSVKEGCAGGGCESGLSKLDLIGRLTPAQHNCFLSYFGFHPKTAECGIVHHWFGFCGALSGNEDVLAPVFQYLVN